MGTRKSSTGASSAINAERLRYVTEHFHTLQGLMWVVIGAFMLLLQLRHVYPDGWLTRWAWPLVLLAVLLPVSRWIRRYYRRRFGWAESRGPRNKDIAIALMVVWVIVIASMGYLSQLLTRVVMSPAILWAAFLCASFTRHPCREEWHNTIFLSSGFLAWEIFALYPLWHPEVAQSMIWKRLDSASVEISLILIGLYNHLTLLRLLPKRIAEADESRNDNEEQ